jgi:hypothetical protein
MRIDLTCKRAPRPTSHVEELLNQLRDADATKANLGSVATIGERARARARVQLLLDLLEEAGVDTDGLKLAELRQEWADENKSV